jgi:hypothetical protein
MNLSSLITLLAALALAGCHTVRKGGTLQTSVTRDRRAVVTASFTPVHVPVLPLTSAASQPSTRPTVYLIPDAEGTGGTLLIPSTITENSTHDIATASGTNDDDPLHPLSINMPNLTATTGGSQVPPEPDTALLGLNSNARLGGTVLLIAGVVVFLLSIIPYTKMLLPIPMWAGPALAAGGLACYALPVLIDRYLWVIVLYAALVGTGVILHLAVKLGYFHRETSPAKIAELKAAGHDDGAGALAYLATGGDVLKAKAVAMPPPGSA